MQGSEFSYQNPEGSCSKNLLTDSCSDGARDHSCLGGGDSCLGAGDSCAVAQTEKAPCQSPGGSEASYQNAPGPSSCGGDSWRSCSDDPAGVSNCIVHHHQADADGCQNLSVPSVAVVR